MIKRYLALYILLISFSSNGQEVSKLPVIAQPTSTAPSKPMIFYISGDGGWNKFSKSLTASWVSKGYPVVSLDASKYFWDKKTATQSSIDASAIITKYATDWNRKKIILVGYSFGADVLPFIFNNANKNLQSEVIGITLLSPSTHTDFEIHVMQMLGSNSGNGESVIDAINQISVKNLLMVFGDDEDDFPVKAVKVSSAKTEILPGGHHYDHAIEEVANLILKYMDIPVQ